MPAHAIFPVLTLASAANDVAERSGAPSDTS